jgi:hypothetical protein
LSRLPGIDVLQQRQKRHEVGIEVGFLREISLVFLARLETPRKLVEASRILGAIA